MRVHYRYAALRASDAAKNDKADSKNIAEYAVKHQDRLVKFVTQPKHIVELKEMVNYRASLVERRKETMVRLSEKKHTSVDPSSSTIKLITRLAKREINELDKMIAECEKQMEAIINDDEAMRMHYRHIVSIKGIGIVNAASIIAYSGDFDTIRTARKMACYCGAVTFYEDSGTSIHKKDLTRTYAVRC